MQVNKKQYFAYRSFWPELETMKKFRETVGVDTFNVMISNTVNSLGFQYTKYPPVWKWNGVYDLDAFDKQLDDIINVVPDAKFLCMLDLNTPHWWTRYLGAFGVRYDSYYDLGKITASKTWRNDTSEYMRTVMEHAQEKYGDRILAYVLGCGGATEWHDRSRSEESVYKLDAFRQWQAKEGKTLTDIPGRMRRDAGSFDFSSDYKDLYSYYNGNDPTGGSYSTIFPNGFGLFRSPEKDQDVMDYFRFCNEFNADTVSYFLAKARQVIPRNVELGCFFGYCFSAWTMTAGHLAYEKLLKDENLDFVIAPIIGYEMGSGSTSATIHETVTLHGKRMLQEMDQKTYCANRVMSDCCELPDPAKVETKVGTWDKSTDGKELAKKFSFMSMNWADEDRVAAGIKRDGAMALINGDSLWWFDMWGGFYQGEKVYSALRKIKEIWDREASFSPTPVADALIVTDPENLYLLNDMNERCGTFWQYPKNLLGQSGAVYELCSFNDLETMDTARYKFVVMCHPFALNAKKRAVLKEKILNRNRTVLWMYGPVINEEGKWDEKNVEKICGLPYGIPGVKTADMGDWKSALVFRAETLQLEEMVALARNAGCRFYCTKPRPVFANERLLCIHTAIPETLTVTLPKKYARLTELFSGEVRENADTFELKADGPDTFLIRLESI